MFRRAARTEYDDAGDWYETQRVGLGVAFMTAVQDVFDIIAEHPERFAIAYQDVREAQVVGFPYCIYYREIMTGISIIAVYHTSRDPVGWQVRV